jgi:hypothetical protein
VSLLPRTTLYSDSEQLQSYLGTVTILLDLQSNGAKVCYATSYFFLVNSNYFVTFKISLTGNCNGPLQ